MTEQTRLLTPTETDKVSRTGTPPEPEPYMSVKTWSGLVLQAEREARQQAYDEAIAAARGMGMKSGKGHGGCIPFVALLTRLRELREGADR